MAPVVTVHTDPADAALKLADARVAVDALKDDPVAMQQLADYALKIAAERHVTPTGAGLVMTRWRWHAVPFGGSIESRGHCWRPRRRAPSGTSI